MNRLSPLISHFFKIGSPLITGLDKLRIQERQRPTPGREQLMVNVKAAGLNFADILARQGMYDVTPKTPCVLGYEAAGIVTELGEGVTDFKVGLF